MGRPSRRPPPSWVKWKPRLSPRGFSTRNSDSPRWAAARSGSVRASSTSTSARAANVHQVLVPLTTQPSATLVAEVLMPATSLPKSGSVTAMAASTSPEARRGSQRSFWARVPPLIRARVMISGLVMSEPPMPRPPHDSSSVATTMPRYSDSPPVAKPPNSSGTDRPKPPSSASPAMIDSGMSTLARCTCSAWGRTCSRAKRWKVSATISKSWPRCRGPGVSASVARNAGSR